MSTVVAATAAGLIALANTATLPTGWTKGSDGSWKHNVSGALCPTKLGSFSLTGLEKGKDENTIGICTYVDGDRHNGQIRVRRYVKGVGDTPLAIQNDQGLMEPSSEHEMIAAVRMTPLPPVDGRELTADVMTITIKGILVDCIVVRGRLEDPEVSRPLQKQCSTMRGM